MKKENKLEQVITPGGKTLSLHEHDGRYFIRVNGLELMSTRAHSSEERIAAKSCERLKQKRGARVLIGGLGFGFTLRATLASVPSEATVVVAELMEAVIAWNRNPAYRLAGDVMTDPRVSVEHIDVVDRIGQANGKDGSGFDAIVLDVDNGPMAIAADENHRLYGLKGLIRMREALRPGGVAAIWSAGEDPAFERQMQRAGYHKVETEKWRAHPTAGGYHTLFYGWVK
jgi:spermidine synthase